MKLSCQKVGFSEFFFATLTYYFSNTINIYLQHRNYFLTFEIRYPVMKSAKPTSPNCSRYSYSYY